MVHQIPITLYGFQAFQLDNVPYNGPLFFARCWECSKLDWKFGHFNGWNLCSTCLEKKLRQHGVIKDEAYEEEVNAKQLSMLKEEEDAKENKC